MREEPFYAHKFGWKDFNWWCDRNGIGIHPDDWMPWWECWKSGYLSGSER
jgi:hypothetical protein